MTRNEESLQTLFSEYTVIKSSREQKAISKFLDKNGNLVNFDRWSYNKYNSILRKTVDSCAENLALYKDDLKKMDKFVIYETEPNGNIINTLYECSRSEFLDMVREHYKEYTGNYPDEDKFDSERWTYINSSHRPVKSSAGTIHCVYLSDITPTEWTKDMALAAIKNSVTNYGYYEYNGKKGLCIVGDFDDIYNFIESVGYVVDEDNLYHWKEFPWDNAKKLDKRYSGQDYWNRKGIANSRKPIKSSKNESEYYYNGWDAFLQGVPRENGPKDTDWWNKMSWLRGWDDCSKECNWWDKNYPIKEEQLSNSRRPIESSVRMIRHPSVQIYLPFTQYNNSPYNFNGIQVNDWGVRLEGSAGGSYAAESTNIDVYNDGTISVYDTKHHLDKTKYYDLELIRDFLKFFKENIDITSYLDKPTATGMVSLSSADTYKIKEWADAHKSVYSSRRPVKSSRY